MQSKPTPTELLLVLTLSRAGTLAEAAKRLGQDGSTVFRAVQRLERQLGQRLFLRGRQGYRPTELALGLLPFAERIEAELEAARQQLNQAPEQHSGTVTIASTDVLYATLLLPALAGCAEQQPWLEFEVQTGNEPVSLTRRDADLALRATRQPPEHLIARPLGEMGVAVFGHERLSWRDLPEALAAQADWLGPDAFLPEHPSVRWRRRHHPKARVRFRLSSIGMVHQGVAAGLGIGVLPLLLARATPGLRQLSEVLPEAASPLWLLAHPESRHLPRVSAVFRYLADTLPELLAGQ